MRIFILVCIISTFAFAQRAVAYYNYHENKELQEQVDDAMRRAKQQQKQLEQKSRERLRALTKYKTDTTYVFGVKRATTWVYECLELDRSWECSKYSNGTFGFYNLQRSLDKPSLGFATSTGSHSIFYKGLEVAVIIDFSEAHCVDSNGNINKRKVLDVNLCK